MQRTPSEEIIRPRCCDAACCPAQRTVLAIMCFLGLALGFAMRTCVAVAVPGLVPVKNNTIGDCTEYPAFHGFDDWSAMWSLRVQSYILASFYLGNTLGTIPGSLYADKYGAKLAVNGSIFISAVCTLLSPVILSENPADFMVLRVIMGLAQGTVFPGITTMLAQWVPLRHRDFTGCLVYGGSLVGTAFGIALPSFLMHFISWVWSFYILGITSLLWCIFFQMLCYSNPAAHPFISRAEYDYLLRERNEIVVEKPTTHTPWERMVNNIPVLAMLAGQMAHSWGFILLINQLPRYMSDLRFTIHQTGLFCSLGFIWQWITSVLSAFLAQYLMKRELIGKSTFRKLMTAISGIGSSIFMMGASYSGCNRMGVFVLFNICLGVMGTHYAGVRLTPMDLSPNYAGSLMALSNGFGQLSGAFALFVTGNTIQYPTISEWRKIFWISFGITNISSVIFCIFGSVEVQKWNEPDDQDIETGF